MNTVSEEGIKKINATTKLVLRKRGDSAVEFSNAAGRLYALHFIEVGEVGSHRVLYYELRLAEGKRGGPPDKEAGQMFIAILRQYLEEHPDDLVCFCHPDNHLSNAINRIFHLWARMNRALYDGQYSYIEGAGRDAENHGLHFMVMFNMACKDIDELKTFILDNSDEFARMVREQINLLHDIERQQYEKTVAC